MSLEQVAPSSDGLAALGARIRAAGATRDRRRRCRRANDSNQRSLALLAQWFMDREPVPSLILDRQLRVVLQNAAASRFLDEIAHLDTRTRAVTFLNKAHQRELVRVLNEVTDRAQFQARVGDVFETIRITAIRTGKSGTLFVRVTASSPVLSFVQRIKSELKLTQAETEIALAISRGCSLLQIAKARNASINTVKTQVRYIYQKTGVCSQVGLARHVTEIV